MKSLQKAITILLLASCCSIGHSRAQELLAFDLAPISKLSSSASLTMGGTECSGTRYRQNYQMIITDDCQLEGFPYLIDSLYPNGYAPIDLTKGDTLSIAITGFQQSRECLDLLPVEESSNKNNSYKVDETAGNVSVRIRLTQALNNTNSGRFITLHRGLNGYIYPLPDFDKVNYHYAP